MSDVTADGGVLTPERAALAGLVPQEWSPGGNQCQKPTNGRTGRCHNRARWCDTAAGERYDRYHETWTREPGSYAYKVCNRHALAMVVEAERATPSEAVVLPDGCVDGHTPDLVSCSLGVVWP